MSIETNYAQESEHSQLWWIAGAVGAAAGLAVWAYRRREPTYWDRTKQAASQVAEAATDINPWVGIGTAALGCAALAYRMRNQKTSWQKAGERADEFFSETAKHFRPWTGMIASAALGAASAAYNSKTRKRAAHTAADKVTHVADQFADAGSRLWRRLQTISGETSKLYPAVRKIVA